MGIKFDNIQIQTPSGTPVIFWLTSDPAIDLNTRSPFIVKSVTGLESSPSELALLNPYGARTWRSREIAIRFLLAPTFIDDDHQNRQLRELIQTLYGGTAVMTTLSLRLGTTLVAYIMVALKDLDVDLNAPDPEYVLTLVSTEQDTNLKSYTGGVGVVTLGTTTTMVSMDNPGPVPVGFIFQAILSAIPATPTALSFAFNFNSPSGFPLSNPSTGSISVTGAPAFAVGDVIRYDSYNNVFTSTRGAVVTNLLSYLALTQGRVFFPLVPIKTTTISMVAKSSFAAASYTPEYVGV